MRYMHTRAIRQSAAIPKASIPRQDLLCTQIENVSCRLSESAARDPCATSRHTPILERNQGSCEKRRAALEKAWRIPSDRERAGALYAIPRTLRQASLLFSHDRARLLATSSWLREIAAWSDATTIVDAGCGHGTLVRILAADNPDRTVIGVDRAENLISIAIEALEDLPKASYACADFTDWKPPALVDLIVTSWGWT